MKFQVLMATMDCEIKDIRALIRNGHLDKTNILMINQCDVECEEILMKDGYFIKMLSCKERGLSRSRNMALRNAEAEICLIADDDMLYEEDVEQRIVKAFMENPNYDLIAFYVERSKSFNEKKIGTKHEISKRDSLGLMSVQIAFRKDAIINNGITFDENFGAGSGTYICGEENIFLFDCMEKGLKILYVPILIASTQENESTWFQGYNELYFISKGALFKRLFKGNAWMMVLIFAILKYRIYKEDATFFEACKAMRKGCRDL